MLAISSAVMAVLDAVTIVESVAAVSKPCGAVVPFPEMREDPMP